MFRIASLVLVASSLAACYPANSPQRSVFDCRVDALRPAVDDALDAADLAREVSAKRASLPEALEGLKVAKAQADAVIAAFKACDAGAGGAGGADAGAQ